jgi:hypothetical protein
MSQSIGPSRPLFRIYYNRNGIAAPLRWICICSLLLYCLIVFLQLDGCQLVGCPVVDDYKFMKKKGKGQHHSISFPCCFRNFILSLQHRFFTAVKMIWLHKSYLFKIDLHLPLQSEIIRGNFVTIGHYSGTKGQALRSRWGRHLDEVPFCFVSFRNEERHPHQSLAA